MRIVITSFGSFGDLNPYVGLGRALKQRGHDVMLALPAAYREFVEGAGLSVHPVRPDIDPSDRDVVRRVMDPLKGAEFLIREWLVPHVEEAYADLERAVEGADLLVSHPLTFAAPVLAEHRRMPWASTVLAPLNFFSQADPPLMAVNHLVEAMQRRWPSVYRHLIPVARVATRGWTRPVQRLRRRIGLPPGADPVHAGQFSPHLVLAMFSRLLAEPQADWPENTVVTGAIAYDAVHGGMPGHVARFLDNGAPPVVFTLGSAAVAAEHASRFYQASVDAAADAGLRALLLVGMHDGHAPDMPRGEDVCIAEWAPHSDVFARASVIVHQGGAGTLHTALRSGRPMLVVPFAHDQGDNAVRAARLGVARVEFPPRYHRRRVAEHLRWLVSDPSYATRATQVQKQISLEGGAASACNALESLQGIGSARTG